MNEISCSEYDFFNQNWGDFNIHGDNGTDAQGLFELLDAFIPVQNVKVPTHNQGHMFDLVIPKGVDLLLTVRTWLSLIISVSSFIYRSPHMLCLKQCLLTILAP